MNDIPFLQEAILKTHGTPAEYLETVDVHETFQGQTVWQGEVEVFTIRGHPKTDKCFAWNYTDDNGTMQAICVLSISPLDTPLNAVRGYVAMEARKNEKAKTKNGPTTKTPKRN
ncbi:MAG TPA: hypothetical protein VFC63_01145 [Blastocatellia bacterium]|nr:hypothetical protein [Blastocatellia bacterium]